MNGENQNNTETVDDAVTYLKSVIDSDDAPLRKAKGENGNGNGNNEENDKEKDYDEDYMKKNMKKFMKDNPDYMKSCGSINKAVTEAYESAEGDLNADATLVDGTEMFKAFKEMGENFTQVISVLDERLQSLEKATDMNTDILAASGEVLLKAHEILSSISKQPQERKSVQANLESLQKAGIPEVEEGKSNLLQKARGMGIPKIRSLFIKAMQNGDKRIDTLMTKLESCQGDLSRVPDVVKLAIELSADKEG